jgi:hypothetical protein
MQELLKQYAQRFGDGFPTIPLAWGRTQEEVEDLIKQCLDAGKDAYEMGFVEDNTDLVY